MEKPIYIEVRANVRYWEDAFVNGQPDELGTLIPFRVDDSWRPIIRLADGQVQDWPNDKSADVHYKVCDDGQYWLLDADRRRIAKWSGDYVPDEFLCHDGDEGFGDYIIIRINRQGFVSGWSVPQIQPDQWTPIENQSTKAKP